MNGLGGKSRKNVIHYVIAVCWGKMFFAPGIINYFFGEYEYENGKQSGKG